MVVCLVSTIIRHFFSKLKGNFYVKNSLFSDKVGNLSFGVDDISNTKNVLLSFIVKKGTGRLIVNFNDHEVFNGEVVGENVAPIVLPKEFLQSHNILEFKTSSIGMVFWQTHEYILENVKVTADMTNTEAQESKVVFIVSDSEKNNLDKASMRFVIGQCGGDKPSKLYVSLNGYTVFSGIPDLETPLNYEFESGRLFSGENELRFRVDSGCYLVDQIVLKSKLKEAFQPFCSFELTDKEYNDITAARQNINLTIKFGVNTDEQDDKAVPGRLQVHVL